MLTHVHCPSQERRVASFFQAYHEHLIELFLLQGHSVSATPMFDPENNCHCLGSPKDLERVNWVMLAMRSD
jgi:hypothetical protein